MIASYRRFGLKCARSALHSRTPLPRLQDLCLVVQHWVDSHREKHQHQVYPSLLYVLSCLWSETDDQQVLGRHPGKYLIRKISLYEVWTETLPVFAQAIWYRRWIDHV